jgi:hypothetical protein
MRFTATGSAVLLLIIGCERPYDHKLDVLPRSQILRLAYYPDGEHQNEPIRWDLDEKARLQVLATLTICGQDKDTQYGIGRKLLVTFVTQKGCFIETQFVKPDQLDRSYGGADLPQRHQIL